MTPLENETPGPTHDRASRARFICTPLHTRAREYTHTSVKREREFRLSVTGAVYWGLPKGKPWHRAAPKEPLELGESVS